ncbi:gibberellin 20-oxidase [Penicillium cosmopolitanum]|uniref:Gibberellin 20-oxidase n=1 Tax=Penicillium cosmopolitanum TaxID=1131564 RepID=A0A9W9VRA0_9EURO|nr:gibberellin 20-oxidase [Penicillium cosmopolitanum]KAJ5387881.1 gibberellin 20-oxidase [Penicillium cosmopolitanum]
MTAPSSSFNASSIPIIDLERARSGAPEEVTRAAQEVYLAFKNVGFAYIKNHGVPQELIDEAFEWPEVFRAPQTDKNKAPHPQKAGIIGVIPELVERRSSKWNLTKTALPKKRKTPDVKESFELGNESDERMPNIWVPDEVLPGFRAFFTRFFEVCSGMEEVMLRTIAVGMGLEKNFFLDYHQNKTNQCRLLHYPAVEEDLLRLGKAERIAAHSDFGTMTILFQDHVGGLEVEDIHEKGKFNPAPYIPGTAVVNIGDLLMRWSNDELKSTLHRVRAPPLVDSPDASAGRITLPRYSIPYFISPDRDRVIDCVPGCYGPDRPKKYESITSGDYISMRMNATY